MTKAPERIWAWKYIGDHNNGGWSRSKLSHAEAEYIRADLSNALIAAAYEAAAADIQSKVRKVFNLWRSFADRSEYDTFANHLTFLTDGLPDTIADRIRALTPADARAALERVAQPRWYRMDDPENPPPKDRLIALCRHSKITTDYFAPCQWQVDGEISEDAFWLWWQAEPGYLTEVKNPTHWTPLLAPPEDEG